MFGNRLQVLKIDTEMFNYLQNEKKMYRGQGVLLKVNPLLGEAAVPGESERMLKVMHAAEEKISFEIWMENGRISLYFWAANKNDAHLLRTQIATHYPNAEIEETEINTFPIFRPETFVSCRKVVMKTDHFYPLETSFTTDPMGAVYGMMSYANSCDIVMVQVVLTKAKDSWCNGYDKVVLGLTNGRCVGWMNPKVVPASDAEKQMANEVNAKTRKIAFQAEIRIMFCAATPGEASSKARQIAAAFSQFDKPSGNGFYGVPVREKKLGEFISAMEKRELPAVPLLIGRKRHAMTAVELSKIVHLPGKEIEIQDIDWAYVKQRMMPHAKDDEDCGSDGIVVCDNEYRGKSRSIVLSEKDMNTHVAVFGKTGFGKSTVIAAMALQHINHGDSVVVIDPHGDLIREIIPRVHPLKCQNVILVEPLKKPIRLNALGIPNRQNLSPSEIETMKDIVISDLVTTLKNIYGEEFWGPRLDYIFTTVAKGLLEKEGSTLLDMYYILTNDKTRKKFADEVQNQVVKNFLDNELPQMKYDLLLSTINKVGKIASNEILRKMLCQRGNTFDIKAALDGDKVILIDLSKGRLGPENTSILGSAIVTQIWMSVLQRAKVPEGQRKRTHLFVDEFQNFASQSFTEILSEARKYRLSLILATQYTKQVKETVWNGIEGNVNTLLSFSVGADDAHRLSRIYTDVEPEEFIKLERYNIVVRKGNVTTQGRTRALGADIIKTNQNYIEHRINRRAPMDDSLVSDYVDWAGEKLNALCALRYMTVSKKREKFTLWEMERANETMGLNVPNELLDSILQDCESHGWVLRTWNGEIFEYSLTATGTDAMKGQIGNGASAGGQLHNDMVIGAFEELCKQGLAPKIVRQGGAAKLPDLEARKNGKKIYVEIESTTTTKPARFLCNLAKAVNEDAECHFVTDTVEKAQKIVDIIAEPYTVDKDGNYEFYSVDKDTEFNPKIAFKRPLRKDDWKIFVYCRENGLCEYNPEEKLAGNELKKNTVLNRVAEYMRASMKLQKPDDVSKGVEISYDHACSALGQLVGKGILIRKGSGWYIHKDCVVNVAAE